MDIQERVRHRKPTADCRCAECGCQYGLDLHHIVPLALGGTNDADNLEWLCGDCHRKKHKYNKSELVKSGMANARTNGRWGKKMSFTTRFDYAVRKYLADNVERMESIADTLDVVYEALDFACDLPYSEYDVRKALGVQQ